MKKLYAQLIAMPRMYKYILAILAIGLMGGLLGILVGSAGQTAFTASVLTH
jgi:hypothetical protein